MAIKATLAIIKAINGVNGYQGTLNGLSKSGSFFLNINNDIIEII